MNTFTFYRLQHTTRGGGYKFIPRKNHSLEDSIAAFKFGNPIESSLPFDEGQVTLVFRELYFPNVGVNVVSVKGFTDYTLYYGIDRVEHFKSDEGDQYVRLYIVKDAWLTFYCLNWETSAFPSVTGEVELSNMDIFINGNDRFDEFVPVVPRLPIAEPTYAPSALKYKFLGSDYCATATSLDTRRNFVLATLVSDNSNELYAFTGAVREPTEGTSLGGISNLVKAVAYISGREASGTKKNYTTTSVHILPPKWLSKFTIRDKKESKDPVEVGTKFTVASGSGSGITSIWGSHVLAEPVDFAGGSSMGFTLLDTLEVAFSSAVLTPSPSVEAWFITPRRWIKMTGDLSIQANRRVAIFGDFNAYYAGGASFAIYAFINGEFVDITDDFSVELVRNEAALKQAQYPLSYGLNVLGNVIGAAGGVIGGVASGNYFGAIQSAVGGTQSLTQTFSARKQAAQIIGEASGAAAVATTRGLLGFVIAENPVDAYALNSLDYAFGYRYPTRPVVTLQASSTRYPFSFLNASSLRTPTLYIKMIDPILDRANFRGGDDDAREIERAFAEGVHLYTHQQD